MEIKKVAVIGSGVMGGGIAAHFANAGVPVLLLDIVPEGTTDRNALAAGALARMAKMDPAPFFSSRTAKLVTPGNLEDDFSALADVDWVVEAIVEDPAVKIALYRQLQEVCRPDAIISSNTSTLPLSVLTHGSDEAFQSRFLITHFFNPPRYMRLLETVAGPHLRADVLQTVTDFADRRLGKSVVPCKDTPGFIANRIGTFWIQMAVRTAFDRGIPVEQADAVLSRPFGVPKTGVFGLIDLVGLDLMPKVAAGLLASLPEDDGYRKIHREEPLVGQMIADGRIGRKGSGGFYRLQRSGGARIKQVIDLASGEYSTAQRPKVDGRAKQIFAADTPEAAYGRQVMAATLAYAASLVPEISDDPSAIDRAMVDGYNWKKGPFALIDEIGAEAVATAAEAEGWPVPPLLAAAREKALYDYGSATPRILQPDGSYQPVRRPDGVLLLADIKRHSKPLLKNGSAALWDIGDGVTCLEFTGKMNTLDQDVMRLIGDAAALTAEKFQALVIYNEGNNFSAGANLGLALFALNIAAWSEIEKLIKGGQDAYKALKYAPFPVVGAPTGLALGGGCEILLHADAIQAHAETYIGLVEVGVGLVPGWGGCKEMMFRAKADPRTPQGPMPAVSKIFETIGTAQVARSAVQAKELLFLRDSDGITMNRDRLLADAKARALELADGYKPPSAPEPITLPGATGHVALSMAVDQLAATGKATPYDRVVADHLANVLTGGEADLLDPVTEEDLLALERREFMDLVRKSGTIERVEHMLETGRPLRN
ncbi:MAG: 3-hydroxyacyl-CoA dehydrogenase/enoyl-CoA hydratase family protein [Pseudomonadota bacterium]